MSKTPFRHRKRSLSLWVVVALCLVGLIHRMVYPSMNERPLQVTTWDALGYYSYLPATFVHDDLNKMEWFESVEKAYHLSGGQNYQL